MASFRLDALARETFIPSTYTSGLYVVESLVRERFPIDVPVGPTSVLVSQFRFSHQGIASRIAGRMN